MFCESEFRQQGLSPSFTQANNSLCIVDLRPESATYTQRYGAELSSENRTMMYVPKGFAHGFITLVDNSELIYMVDEPYDAPLERGVRWNDPAFALAWPLQPTLVSDRDQAHPLFSPEN